MNMNAKAPIINGAIHMKILELSDQQKSKIYTADKIQKIKEMKNLPQQQTQSQSPDKKHSQFQRQQQQQQQREQQLRQQQQQKEQQQQKQQQQKSSTPKKTPKQQEENLFEFSPEQKPQEDLMDNDDNDDWNLESPKDVKLKQPEQKKWGEFSKQQNQATDLIDMTGSVQGVYDPKTGQFKTREQLDQDKKDAVQAAANAKLDEFQKIQDEENRKKTLRDQKSDEFLKKVHSWAYKDKQRQNIRKLIASLHEVLWEGCDWKPVSLSELLTDAQVKKHYHKCLIKIHPDKNRGKGAEIEYLAETIIGEIKIAWNEYREGKQ